MRKFYLLLFASIAICSQIFAASSGTCGDNLTWTLINDSTLLISGTGAMTDYRGDNYRYFNPWLDLDYSYNFNFSIKEVVISYGVTTIGEYAFYALKGLRSVSIPLSVTSIKKGAFCSCTGLHEVDIPNSITFIGDMAFCSCAIKNIAIPNSVQSIGKDAFSQCYNLKNVILPNGLQKIQEGTFHTCRSLNSITIPNTIIEIEQSAFERCDSLHSITIPKSVQIIGDYVFRSYSRDTANMEITMESTTPCKIGKSLFGTDVYSNDLSGIFYVPCGTLDDYYQAWNKYDIRYKPLSEKIYATKVEHGYVLLPESECDGMQATAIPNYGYHFVKWSDGNTDNPRVIPKKDAEYTAEFAADIKGKCGDNLIWEYYNNKLSISGTGTMYDYGYFFDESQYWSEGEERLAPWCASSEQISTIELPQGITNIGARAFEGCVNLTSISIPKNVTSIGDYAFNGCIRLTSITIPQNVTRVGYNSFSNCSELKTIVWNAVNCTYVDWGISSQITSFTLGDGVKTIPEDLCSGMNNLKSVHIPNSVTSIGDYAFSYCGSLTSITIPNSVTKLGSNAFSECGSLKEVNLGNGIERIERKTFYECPNITELNLPNSLKVIEASAFYNCIGITNLVIPNSVDTIMYSAFQGLSELETLVLGKSIKYVDSEAFGDCKRLLDIYCYAERIPEVYSDPFYKVSRKATLWVPENRVRNYKIDSYWSQFDIQAMAAESVNTDKVLVTPDYNTANVAWPSIDNANTYELVIKDKQGNEICTLVFNSNGQLQSIAFRAPAANGNQMPEQTAASGFRFTVTGLESGSKYSYSITAKDLSGKTIQNYTGTFYTLGATGVEDIEAQTNSDATQATKVLENGIMYILLPDGRKYNLQGAEMR